MNMKTCYELRLSLVLRKCMWKHAEVQSLESTFYKLDRSTECNTGGGCLERQNSRHQRVEGRG